MAFLDILRDFAASREPNFIASREAAKPRMWMLAGFTASCAMSAPALAQTDEIVVTGNALPVAKGDAAYTIVTIDRDRITSSASNRIEDILKDVAGLTQFRRSDARSANATSQGATLRGLGGNASSRALLILDGVPQTDPFGGWVTWSAFATNRIGSVRVTRGGGTGSAGPGALAGTIDLASIGPGDENGASGSFAYGSRRSIDANALLAGTLGGGFAFLSASYARGDGFIPIIERQRGPADRAAPYEQVSLAGRALIPLSAQTELQANALGFTDKRTRGTILSANGGTGADTSLRIVHQGDWAWSALAYLQLRKFRSGFVSIDPARALVAQTVDQYNVPSTGVGAAFEVRPPLGEAIELRLGGDWRRTSGETRELFTYVGGSPTRGRRAGGLSNTIGAFAEATASLGDLTLTGGVRADHWEIKSGHLVEHTLATGALLRNEVAPDRDGWETTGRAGAAYEIGAVTLRAAAYLGWRLPTLNELYRPFRVGADATAASAALDPERMRGAEVALDWKWSESGHLGLTGFINTLRHPIANVTLASGPGLFPGVGFVAAGGAYRQRQNLDTIRSKGLEIEGRQTLGDFYLAASYAFTDARMRSSGAGVALNGRRPAQVPKHSVSMTLGWRWISGTMRWVSSQFEDDLNQRELASAVTLDGTAAIPLSSHISLILRGENVTNRRVEAAISGLGVIERATPRTLWLGIAVRQR